MPSTIPSTSSTPIDASSSPAPLGATAILSHAPSKRRDKANVINGFVALRDALSASSAASATLELPSGTFTVPELTEEIDEYIAAVAAVTAATLAFHAAVEKEQKLRASAFARRAELKAVTAARIGKHATAMATYGFAPAKVRVVSPKAKLVGAIKAKATRIARGTMGHRQKQAISGNVMSVIVTPVTHAAGQANVPDSPGPVTAGLSTSPSRAPS
jgi:hypothetical protein